MDKIVEIKDSKNFNDSKIYRFQCGCYEASDAMDVEVERVPQKNKWISITMNLRDVGIWQRIKDAFNVLMGCWHWREFVVREEDFKNLSDIFNPEKEFEDLP